MLREPFDSADWGQPVPGTVYRVVSCLQSATARPRYLVDDRRVKRRLALTTLPIQGDWGSPAWRQRMDQWGELTQLGEPGLLGLEDFGITSEGWAYYATAYHPGESVRQRIDGARRLGHAEALALADAALGALVRMHEQGMVHANLTPARLNWAGDSETWLCDPALEEPDFCHFAPRPASRPETTLRYLAPELLRGEPLTDRVDIYALGVILFEALTGQHPFDWVLAADAGTSWSFASTDRWVRVASAPFGELLQSMLSSSSRQRPGAQNARATVRWLLGHRHEPCGADSADGDEWNVTERGGADCTDRDEWGMTERILSVTPAGGADPTDQTTKNDGADSGQGAFDTEVVPCSFETDATQDLIETHRVELDGAAGVATAQPPQKVGITVRPRFLLAACLAMGLVTHALTVLCSAGSTDSSPQARRFAPSTSAVPPRLTVNAKAPAISDPMPLTVNAKEQPILHPQFSLDATGLREAAPSERGLGSTDRTVSRPTVTPTRRGRRSARGLTSTAARRAGCSTWECLFQVGPQRR